MVTRHGIEASDSVESTKPPKLFFDSLDLLHSIGRSCHAMHTQAALGR